MGTADVCIDHMADWPIDKSDDLKKLLALAEYTRVYVKRSATSGRCPRRNTPTRTPTIR
jgi:hypothetical protein